MLTNGSEVTLQGKRVRLRPCEETDMDTMYKWRNDMSTLHLWSIRRHTVNFDEFAAELKADFAIDRHIQLMIEKVADNSVVGTIYSYNAQFVDGHCWITIYIEPDKTRVGFGAEAVAFGMENGGMENGDAPQSNTSFAIRTIFVFFVVFCPPHR